MKNRFCLAFWRPLGYKQIRLFHSFALFACLILLLGSSCLALIEDEFPDFTAMPVMNGLLVGDSVSRVHVSLTGNLNDSVPRIVDNAFVTIEDTRQVVDTLTYTGDGWYQGKRKAEYGEIYTCRASIPGYDQMVARATIPLPTLIDSFVYTELAIIDEMGYELSSVEFRIPNNVNSKQYWAVELVLDGLWPEYDPHLNAYEYVKDVRPGYIWMFAEQDPVLLHEAAPLTVFSNNRMQEEFYWVKVYYDSKFVFDTDETTPYIQLKSIDEPYYKYVKQYHLYEIAGEITLGKGMQKYPLYSNVTNGTGVLAGCAITRKELLKPM